MSEIVRCTTPGCEDATRVVTAQSETDMSKPFNVRVVPLRHVRVAHASGLVHEDGSYEVETFTVAAR